VCVKFSKKIMAGAGIPWFDRKGPSLRPDLRLGTRRAQGAVKAGRRPPPKAARRGRSKRGGRRSYLPILQMMVPLGTDVIAGFVTTTWSNDWWAVGGTSGVE
jgi:hypothetical protein